MRLGFSYSPSIRRARTVAAIILVPVTVLTVLYSLGFRQNLTKSQPPGIYRLTNKSSDPLVSFCPTGEASQVTTQRGYRATSWACPDGHAPMLKPIAARPGDTVTVSKSGITVNGIPLPNTRSYPFDARHYPLHQWPAGTYAVAPGTMWVLSTYNDHSYDSRYFGPINAESVIQYGHLLYRY
jgi:conjugative transfer signal peptidase TraF